MTYPTHPPITQTFNVAGIIFNAVGADRWNIAGEIVSSKELYRRQAAAR